MRPLLHKFKPAGGFSQLLHLAYRIALPVLVFILVRLNIGLWVPIMVIILSKWRIFAVRPRFWPANVRANAIDIIFGIAMVLFMAHSDSQTIQLGWVVVYAIWLLYIKPRSSILFISLQAAIGQFVGLMALFWIRPDASTAVLVLVGGVVCYLAARHFFESYNEPYTKMLAYIWGYFGAALLWVLGHMLIVYPRLHDRLYINPTLLPDGAVAMPTLLLSVVGYSLAAVYYLEHFDRLSRLVKREVLFLGGAVVMILMVSLFYEGAHLIV